MILIFDLDGPLLDVRGRYCVVHAEALAAAGLPPGDLEAAWERRRAREPQGRIIGTSDPERRRAYEACWRARIEADALLPLDRLQPGALEALAAIPSSVTRALVSMRSNVAGAEATIDRLGLRGCFDSVCIVPHHVGTKDAAFRVAAGAEPPETVVVIGDTEVDLDAAHRCGYRSIAVANGIRNEAWLRASNAGEVVHDVRAAVALALRPTGPL